MKLLALVQRHFLVICQKFKHVEITDYLVVCDTSNNTPEIIDRNEFVAEIFVKPTRSINFVTVTVTATKSGVSFQEVVGR